MATKARRSAAKTAKPAAKAKPAVRKSTRAAPGRSKGAASTKAVASAPATGAVIKRGDLFAELDAWFDRTLRRGWPAPFDFGRDLLNEAEAMLGARSPRVDVVNRDRDILVRAELPGMQKKDVDVSLTERTLTIRAASSQEKKEEKANFFRREISEQSFARTITLPGNTDTRAARADLKDGVLEVVIPKLSGPKPRTIDVV